MDGKLTFISITLTVNHLPSSWVLQAQEQKNTEAEKHKKINKTPTLHFQQPAAATRRASSLSAARSKILREMRRRRTIFNELEIEKERKRWGEGRGGRQTDLESLPVIRKCKWQRRWELSKSIVCCRDGLSVSREREGFARGN